MSSEHIDFAVWAPNEVTFWASWDAGGVTEVVDGERRLTRDYPGIEVSASWGGIIVKTPEVIDAQGNVTTPAVLVPGWHCNVRVTGPLVAEMTYGLPQFDADGELLPLFDRTWAAEAFQLTEQTADAATGFPAGYRSVSGVTYADPREISTPANVRQ